MIAVAVVTVEMVVRAGEVALYHAQLLTHVLKDVFDGPGVHHVGILGIRHVNFTSYESARLIDTPAVRVGLLLEAGPAVLNFFVNRATNAGAESFNAKVKAFRAQFRGVSDIPFFLFRLMKLCA